MRDEVLKRFWENGKPEGAAMKGVKTAVCLCGKRTGGALGVSRYDILTAMYAELKRSFRIGLASARANLVPMLVLQLVAVGLAAAYYLLPGFRQMTEPVAGWHLRYGWRAAFASQAFFCGLLPGLFMLVFRTIRPKRPVLTVSAQALWCGGLGICCNALFRLMSEAFGDNVAISPVVAKALIDQFAWTVIVIAPANAVFFFWLGRDFSLKRVREDWSRPFYRRMVLPNLIPNWIVWIPTSLAVFSFPYSLQIHVNGIVCTFWVLVCLQIGRRT